MPDQLLFDTKMKKINILIIQAIALVLANLKTALIKRFSGQCRKYSNIYDGLGFGLTTI